MNNAILKERLQERSDVIFYIAFVLYWSLNIVWTSTAMGFLTKRGYILGMAMVIALLLVREAIRFGAVRKYGVWDYLGLVIVGLLGYIVNRNETGTIAVGYLLIFASREMDYKKVFQVAIANTIVGIFAIYVLAACGYITNETWQEGEYIRHAFGFTYPLVIPAYFLNIGIMTFAIREEKITTVQILLLTVFTFLTYRWCKADLSSGLMVIVLIAMVVVKKWPSILQSQNAFWKWTDHLAACIYPLAFIVSFLLADNYNSSISWMSKLNTWSRERLRLPYEALHSYDIKIWGQEIGFIGSGLDQFGNHVTGNYSYVDNAYINLLLRYGVIFCVIALVLLVLTMNYCRIHHMRILLWMFALMAVHGLFEDKVQTLYFNSLLLLIGRALQDHDESKKHT